MNRLFETGILVSGYRYGYGWGRLDMAGMGYPVYGFGETPEEAELAAKNRGRDAI